MRFALLVAAGLAAATPAIAGESYNITLTGGETLRQPFFTYIRQGCQSSGVFKLEVVEPPKHGKVSFRYEDVKKDDTPCKDMTFRANVLYYKPDPGYKGSDALIMNVGHSTMEGSVSMTKDTMALYFTLK